MTTASTTNLHGDQGHGHDHGGHDPHLAHHFDTPEQQFMSAKLGMWVFLGTEVLMFGGLFCAYSVYRHNHPDVFAFAAEKYLSIPLGALNTVILITSSLTMAWGVRAAQLNQQKLLRACLIMTLIGAAGFLIVKTFEYRAKWRENVWVGRSNRYSPQYTGSDADKMTPPVMAVTSATPVPGGDATATDANSGSNVSQIKPHFSTDSGLIVLPGAETEPAPDPRSEEGITKSYDQLSPADQYRVGQFFSCYFLMTGLHGVHVVVGMGLITWIYLRARKNEFSSEFFTPVDLVGLYWHLVDLIWIFLFPLLYLIH
jgi:cytochrome c oxidase subunit 3